MFAAAGSGTALADFDRVFDRFAGKIPCSLDSMTLCHGHHYAVRGEKYIL